MVQIINSIIYRRLVNINNSEVLEVLHLVDSFSNCLAFAKNLLSDTT